MVRAKMQDALARLLPRLSRLPALEGDRNLVRDAWTLLSRMPGGRALFSRVLGRMAPYTGSISASVVELLPGRSEVHMQDRPRLRNHLDSLHAVALANLGELAGNIALAFSLPGDARFIVSGIEIEYVKKARGTIVAIGECAVPKSNARMTYDVMVSMRDGGGAEVATAVLHSLVGPKAPAGLRDLGNVN